jgi:hypothetical protein
MSKKKADWGLILAFSLLVVGLLFLFVPYKQLDGSIRVLGYYITISDYGELGSFIGGVTTPFLSIAAFILLYRTYKSQKEELDNTRKVMQAQNETIEKQQFESTFFKMLDLYNSIVSNMHIVIKGIHSPPEIYGRDCFIYFYTHFGYIYQRQKKKYRNENEVVLIKAAYIELFTEFEIQLEYYFRNLLQIIKFVDSSTVKSKLDYMNILKAQFSANELLLVFYMGLSSYGEDHLKPLIEEYKFLSDLPEMKLLSAKHFAEYSISAYGEKVPSMLK